MLKYWNGKFSLFVVPKLVALEIVAGEENGQPLVQHFPLIIKDYKKYAECIAIVNGDQDPVECKICFEMTHEVGRKTCLRVDKTDMSMLNKRLVDECDYIWLKDQLFEKQNHEWINITEEYKKYENIMRQGEVRSEEEESRAVGED